MLHDAVQYMKVEPASPGSVLSARRLALMGVRLGCVGPSWRESKRSLVQAPPGIPPLKQLQGPTLECCVAVQGRFARMSG